jgi:hypothetical protein
VDLTINRLLLGYHPIEQAYPLAEVYLFLEVAGLKTAHHEEVKTSILSCLSLLKTMMHHRNKTTLPTETHVAKVTHSDVALCGCEQSY